MYMYSFFCFPHILLKVKSVLNLLAHPAVAYPGFHVAKQQEVLPLPPWMRCWSIARLPPSISSGFRDNSQVPIYTPEWREALWG